MSTPSSSIDEQPPRRRDLRDSTFGRVAILVAVLAIAALSARSCAGGGNDALTQKQAVDVARGIAVVEDGKVLVRYLNQGIPPRGTWIVSFYTGPSRHPITSQTVMVDAQSGQIVDDGR